MTARAAENTVRSTASQRIIAAGIVIAFIYWASSVVMILFLAMLLAHMLDPVVEGLERFRLPRGLASLLVVLVVLGLLSLLGYLVWAGAARFVEDWPAKYAPILKHASASIEKKLERFEFEISRITPQGQSNRPTVRVQDERPFRSVLLGVLGSLYSVLFAVSFLPFLIFFMLAAKRNIWHATLQLFPLSDRTQVKETLEAVSAMLRGYVFGNTLVVGILAMASWLFFWFMGLDYPLLTGVVSGILSLVPYLGVVLAWLPPMVIGLTKYNHVAPFVGIAVAVAVFHLVAVNVLMPALVGKRVQLNALAVTIALLFWGWLWGGLGLVLAIPITATVKVICDHMENWQPLGRWMGT